jgi:hypothetical protein
MLEPVGDADTYDSDSNSDGSGGGGGLMSSMADFYGIEVISTGL